MTEETPRSTRARRSPSTDGRRAGHSGAERDEEEGPSTKGTVSKGSGSKGSGENGRIGAAAAAQRAAREVAALTGRDVESVSAIEPCEDAWKVELEVVETRRIPDSADILGSYEVRLDADGDLVSYKRTQRYARGQLYGGRR